jgi:hypothetical protein
MIIVSSNRICLKSHSGLSRKKRTVTSEFLRLVAVLLSKLLGDLTGMLKLIYKHH